MMRKVRARALVAAVALAAGVLGAGGSAGAAGGGAGPVSAARAPELAPAADTCDTTRSVPPAKDPGGPKIKKIRERGTLVVGIDQNSYHWGYRNPQTGTIEGFDIDLAHAIAKSLLGDPDKITFKAVPTARRIDAVKAGEVDLVVRTTTITCARMQEVAFSRPYFAAGQRLVVPKSAKATSVDQGLKGKRVCTAASSSSDTELKTNRHGASEVTVVENQLDCLVLMQLGKVDATLTDAVLAAAQAAQDPTVEVVGETLLAGWMGVVVNQADTDLVAWVNQALLDYRADGGWRRSYDHWLAGSMGTSPDPYEFKQ
ncbi:glutamate ABC transporter substrate-binding protein [Kitasatospora sp. NPDC048540]|uniref:glutamate ABC transporter substrate-binding protein n=1 Tax=unclassified Kitasatospora TaxID=2633591 RepID=UPI00053A1F17|nr:glutamate ABC transporter substrate-binding protein [Kitasatospora sp. MBT63]